MPKSDSIQIFRRTDLNDEIRKQVDDIAAREFGEIPIIRDTAWSVPDWHVIFLSDHTVLSILSIIERRALFDGAEVCVAGIANVITVKGQREKGLGTRLLNRTHEFIRDSLRADWGLLLCSEDVTPFYLKLGWIKTTAALTYNQPEGKREWSKDVLICPSAFKGAPKEKIDLCGLPW